MGYAPDEFYSLNPAGRTPVLEHKEKSIVLADSQAICEYLEESTDERPLILGTALGRAEIRRLVALFGQLPQTAPPAGDNCHFGNRKKYVSQNQSQEEKQPYAPSHVSVCPENAKPEWQAERAHLVE